MDGSSWGSDGGRVSLAAMVTGLVLAGDLMIEAETIALPRCLNLVLDKAPSFLFCSALSIVLSLWYNMLRNRFKRVFVGANVLMYALLVTLGVAQAVDDPRSPATPGDVDDDMTGLQKTLWWLTTVLYIPLAVAFLVVGC
eukprot:m51a1_g2861 hypothetical protein (140) ;mRNA; r:341191-343260